MTTTVSERKIKALWRDDTVRTVPSRHAAELIILDEIEALIGDPKNWGRFLLHRRRFFVFGRDKYCLYGALKHVDHGYPAVQQDYFNLEASANVTANLNYLARQITYKNKPVKKASEVNDCMGHAGVIRLLARLRMAYS